MQRSPRKRFECTDFVCLCSHACLNTSFLCHSRFMNQWDPDFGQSEWIAASQAGYMESQAALQSLQGQNQEEASTHRLRVKNTKRTPGTANGCKWMQMAPAHVSVPQCYPRPFSRNGPSLLMSTPNRFLASVWWIPYMKSMHPAPLTFNSMIVWSPVPHLQQELRRFHIRIPCVHDTHHLPTEVTKLDIHTPWCGTTSLNISWLSTRAPPDISAAKSVWNTWQAAFTVSSASTSTCWSQSSSGEP